MVNQDVLQGKWKQFRGTVKEKWGQLTDNDLQQINGNAEKLVGVLQERYGYVKEDAQREVDRFIANLE